MSSGQNPWYLSLLRLCVCVGGGRGTFPLLLLQIWGAPSVASPIPMEPCDAPQFVTLTLIFSGPPANPSSAALAPLWALVLMPPQSWGLGPRFPVSLGSWKSRVPMCQSRRFHGWMEGDCQVLTCGTRDRRSVPSPCLLSISISAGLSFPSEPVAWS